MSFIINQTTVDLLRLSNREVKVLAFLKQYPQSQIADIAKNTKIARMTVYLNLKSLKKRGLIHYNRKGQRKLWHIISDKLIAEIVTNVAVTLSNSHEMRVSVNDSGFAVVHGIEGLYKMWKHILDLPANSRVYGIKPTSSMKHTLSKLEWQKIRVIQEQILAKPIIIDGVLTEDYYEYIADFYKSDRELQKKVLESYLGRATDMTFVSKEYFKLAESELILLSDIAFISDWKNEVAIEIRNPIMLNFLRELYDFAKDYGKKVDQNAYIKGLLERLS